jgi:pectate lyase
MRAFKRVILLAASLFFLVVGNTALAGNRDLGTEVLGPNDGWAASGTGTTGGSLATPDQVYTVTNRRELIAALNNGVPSSTSPSAPSNTPKIIYVSGTIDVNVDDENNPLTCEDYFAADPGLPSAVPPIPPSGEVFSYEAFEAAFDPQVWGRVNPSGPQERARLASQAVQMARVRIRPGSNTTIVGLGKGAKFRGIWLDIRGSAAVPRENIIVRNITFEDTYDCFPQWAPTDGANGSWNALYDSISLRDSRNVWIDHNTFRDRRTRDATLPIVFGVLFQVHDGLVDITNASDLVTVSWNKFLEHDKVMLIGSSDNAPLDVNKLRVTLHHNLFDTLGQRGPRVRFGQVHVYNNYYKVPNADTYQYSWGVGIQSKIYAESNFFCTETTLDAPVTPDRFIERLNGTAIHAADTLVWSTAAGYQLVDVLAEYNAVNDPDLASDVGWAPTLFEHIDPVESVELRVEKRSGPMAW